MNKKSIPEHEVPRLALVSVLTGLACALLAYTLKKFTEHAEAYFVQLAGAHSFLYFILPATGLAAIYFLRQYLFGKKENKGIREIYNDLKHRDNGLPFYKIPSHYINGFLTVISGGSTGVEVSTVVAAATTGSLAHKKGKVHFAFRKELICAAVAAGVTALFGSPIAGILFSFEVISKRRNKFSLLSMLLATATAWGFTLVVQDELLFPVQTEKWHYAALPYFILLGIFAGVHSAYLTRCVLFFKSKYSGPRHYPLKVLLSSVILGTCLFFFPQLYGEGYASIKEVFLLPDTSLNASFSLFVIASLFILKPIVSAATLWGGGDGGVFAPSMFMGAFLGLFVALVFNKYFQLHLIPLNFMIIGMAAVLSASLHAPFTSLFLVCGITGSYILFIPLLITCLVSKFTAQAVLPYTVYSFIPAPASFTTKDRL